MTDQYLPTNINAPRLPRETDVDLFLTLDDEFVIITANAPQITLPTAVQIPSRQIYIKSILGGGTVVGFLGQTIDGAGSFTFTAANEVLPVKSDGANWLIVGGGYGGSGAALTVENDGTVVGAATTLINFIGAGVIASYAGGGAVDVTIPGTSLPSGPLIPETNISGSPGGFYTRVAGAVSSSWQFVSGTPGILGWEAIGPLRTAVPVGETNESNTSFSFPGGVEAVHQGVNKPQIKYILNGLMQKETVNFSVVAGSIAGTTITSITTVIAPSPGDVLEFTYIPA